MFAHSTLGTYPYPYPELQPSLPVTTHLIYNLPIDGRAADLAGFSYFTKNLGGGNNEVVFMTGPNSDAKMNEEVAAMKEQLSSPAPSSSDSTESTQEVTADSDSSKNSGDDKEAKDLEENPNASTPSTVAPAEAKETSTPVTKNGEKDVVNQEFHPEQSFVLRAPYPILRIRGSTTYYPQSTGVFPGYEPFDYFKSQYDPFYGHYNSYQTLYHPFYSTIDDYYNRLAPLPYYSSVHPETGSNFVSGESLLTTYPDSQGVPEVKQKIGPIVESEKTDSTVKDSANAEAVEPQVTDGATAEKKTELSTSTEQSKESSTPVSATSGSEQSSTQASSTETTAA